MNFSQIPAGLETVIPAANRGDQFRICIAQETQRVTKADPQMEDIFYKSAHFCKITR